MALYFCRVSDSKGKLTEFTQESSSEEALLRELQTKGLFPLRIEESSGTQAENASKKRFRPNAILDFTETLGLLLTSGLSLKDALLVALTIFKKGHARVIITQILEKINKGLSFYNSLESFGNNFPPLYRGLVRIGEKVGSLDAIFVRLAKYLTENKKIREKIVGSIIYPLIIMSFILVGALLMTFLVFPTIGNIFSQFGAQEVKEIQSRLLFYNVFMGVLFGIAMVIFILAAVLSYLRRKGGEIGIKIDAILLKLPIIGTIILYRESMNFLFAMETLTGSGYSIEEALGEAGFVLKNHALRSAIMKIREKITRGDSIAEAFREQKLFPERIAQWLFVGERSGQVEKVFAQLSTYYQNEIDKWATRFMAWIEPALMLFVGIFVLVFVALFILPIFSMYGKILRK